MAEKDLDTTRDRILEAAGQMFAERGFETTTVRDICQAAGANVAAVNYYFRDKERLYIEAVVRAHRWRLDQAKLPDWTPNTPAKQKLADFIVTFFRRVLGGPDNTWHTRLVMREILHPSAACVELAQSNIRPQFEILQGILRELLPPDVTNEELHLTAFSIVGQCLFYHFADPVIRNLIEGDEYASFGIDKLAEHVSEFSLAAIEAMRTAKESRSSPAKGAPR